MGHREYENNQYSTGGLNIFKPVSQLTSSRVNFNLFISNAGNVGVGIGDPTQKLDIDGNIRLRNNAIIGTWSSNSLTFNTNSAARMVIAATGNVGIGTIEPSAKLQVANGDIFIEDIDRGIIMKSPDGHCWRGILNNPRASWNLPNYQTV
ncbi:MAG: hypothetical protein M9948_12990 [Lentimicrobium sp.]|nr:hypothetical protein [Lentimicrobium sp.]